MSMDDEGVHLVVRLTNYRRACMNILCARLLRAFAFTTRASNGAFRRNDRALHVIITCTYIWFKRAFSTLKFSIKQKKFIRRGFYEGPRPSSGLMRLPRGRPCMLYVHMNYETYTRVIFCAPLRPLMYAQHNYVVITIL